MVENTHVQQKIVLAKHRTQQDWIYTVSWVPTVILKCKAPQKNVIPLEFVCMAFFVLCVLSYRLLEHCSIQFPEMLIRTGFLGNSHVASIYRIPEFDFRRDALDPCDIPKVTSTDSGTVRCNIIARNIDNKAQQSVRVVILKAILYP